MKRSTIRSHRHLTAGAQIRSAVTTSTKMGQAIHRNPGILLHKSGQQGIAISSRSLGRKQAERQGISSVGDYSEIHTQLPISRVIGQLPEGEVAAIGSKSENRAEGDAEVVVCAVVEVDLVAEFEAQT